MIVSLVGSHGTGKSAVFSKIKEKHPEWLYFKEGVRHQVPSFGYEDPYKIIDQFGVAAFELINMNSWSVIDPKVNTVLDPKKTIVTDRSAIDNYAYYLTLRKTSEEFRMEKLLNSMAKHYSSLADLFIYFPIAFELKPDKMRPADKGYQKKVDENILKSFDILRISKSKIHKLTARGVDERVNEILQAFSSLKR